MTSIRLKIAALAYGLLAAAAVVWGVLRGDPDIFHHPEGLIFSIGEEIHIAVELLFGGAAGVAFGLGISKLTRFSVYRFKWARALHIEFRGLFGPLRNRDIFAYAAFSALAEEMFFRGALQAELGIVPASLLFGVLHIAPNKKYLPWPFQAVTMGFAFGFLYWMSGSLAAPVLAHFTINYQNLHFINSYDPSLQLPRSFTSGLRSNRR